MATNGQTPPARPPAGGHEGPGDRRDKDAGRRRALWLVPVLLIAVLDYWVLSTMPRGAAHVTLPYALALAGKGWRRALGEDPALALGLNAHAGRLAHAGVAEAHGLPFTPAADLLGGGPVP